MNEQLPDSRETENSVRETDVQAGRTETIIIGKKMGITASISMNEQLPHCRETENSGRETDCTGLKKWNDNY